MITHLSYQDMIHIVRQFLHEAIHGSTYSYINAPVSTLLGCPTTSVKWAAMSNRTHNEVQEKLGYNLNLIWLWKVMVGDSEVIWPSSRHFCLQLPSLEPCGKRHWTWLNFCPHATLSILESGYSGQSNASKSTYFAIKFKKSPVSLYHTTVQHCGILHGSELMDLFPKLDFQDQVSYLTSHEATLPPAHPSTLF